MRPRFLIILPALFACCASCKERDYSGERTNLRIDTPDMSEVVVALPDSTGRELVETSCVPCHSLRYIEMQPPMSRENWEKIVSKMITAFGAPVRDSATAAGIVNYLVSIRGAGNDTAGHKKDR